MRIETGTFYEWRSRAPDLFLRHTLFDILLFELLRGPSIWPTAHNQNLKTSVFWESTQA